MCGKQATGFQACQGCTEIFSVLHSFALICCHNFLQAVTALCKVQAQLSLLPGTVRPFDAVLLARWRPDKHALSDLPALVKAGGVVLIAPDPGHMQAWAPFSPKPSLSAPSGRQPGKEKMVCCWPGTCVPSVQIPGGCLRRLCVHPRQSRAVPCFVLL